MAWLVRSIVAAGALCTLGTSALAEVAFDAVRLGVPDVRSAATFYEQVFGMRNVDEVHKPGVDEVFLALGATGPAPDGGAQPRLILWQRKAELQTDELAHVVLRVTDIAATSRAAKAAGGTLVGDPHPIPGAMIIAEIIDPAKNHVQLIQSASR